MASIESGSLTNLVAKDFLLPVTTLFASISLLISSIFDIPVQVFGAFASGVSNFVGTIFNGAAQMLGVGASVSANSVQSGPWAQFGPLTFAVMIAAIIAGLYVIAWYRNLETTGNLVAFIPFDVPLVGSEGEEE